MKKIKKILNYKHSKLILGAIVIVVMVVPFWFLRNNNKKIASLDDKKVFAHMEPDIVKEETYENLKMSNIIMITDNGYTTFTADVTNTGEDALEYDNVNIELRDEEGNIVVVLLGNIGEDLKANETRTISASAKGEFRNVSSKTISQHE